jgi:P2 family phage contractile tail tube protein
MGAKYSLSQSNLLIAGSSTQGIIKEFKVDDLEANTESYDPIGMLGQQDVPVGFKQLTASLTFAGPSPDFYAKAILPWKTTTMTILGVMVNNSMQGASANTQFKCEMTVRPNKAGLGSHASQKMTEFDRAFLVDKIKITMGGVEQLEYDQQNSIYRVLGVDEWQAFRTILGE